MTAQEFWHENPKLFQSYQKAYIRKNYDMAWTIGLYVNIAVGNIVKAVFAKKGEKIPEYPNAPVDVFEENKKKIKNKDELENKFRNSYSNLNWLSAGVRKE